MRHGRRGIVNVPEASSTKMLRATKWSHSRMLAGPCTGATGMRSSLAIRTMSAVVCCVVHACTISFHSSHRAWRSTWLLNSSVSMRSGRPMSSRKLWNCSRLLVQTPTYPSRVGSTDGVSMVRVAPWIGGLPSNARMYSS